MLPRRAESGKQRRHPSWRRLAANTSISALCATSTSRSVQVGIARVLDCGGGSRSWRARPTTLWTCTGCSAVREHAQARCPRPLRGDAICYLATGEETFQTHRMEKPRRPEATGSWDSRKRCVFRSCRYQLQCDVLLCTTPSDSPIAMPGSLGATWRQSAWRWQPACLEAALLRREASRRQLHVHASRPAVVELLLQRRAAETTLHAAYRAAL